MNKYFISFFLILNSVLLFAKNDKLYKARQKFNNYKSVSYVATAFYPNPETEEINSFKTFYIINNYKSKNFDFYSKTDHSEEIFKNNDYTEILAKEKTIYKYEDRQNQNEMIQHSRPVQYGPTFLIHHDWKYENDVFVNGTQHSHYSFIESTNQYEGKTIKIEFNIYISSQYTISKFERKVYTDNKPGQTVTYNYDHYNFSKKELVINTNIPESYSLKYFERRELNPLKEGIQAPGFTAHDLENNEISNTDFTGKNTLLLFSGTNCGASIEVFKLLNNENFHLPNNLKLIHFYASDSKEAVQKLFSNKKINFPIIADQKDMEEKFQVSGYPVLYLVNENGMISKTFDGLEPIADYLKSINKK